MVDNKSKTSLIRYIQKNISLMKINNTVSSFMIYFSVYVIREIFLFYSDHLKNRQIKGVPSNVCGPPKWTASWKCNNI